MTKYECLFVLSTKTLDDAALEATTEKFKDLITKNGGVIENVEVWGKRRLAYAINFEADSKVPAELDRVFNITTGVLRSMIIKK